MDSEMLKKLENFEAVWKRVSTCREAGNSRDIYGLKLMPGRSAKDRKGGFPPRHR